MHQALKAFFFVIYSFVTLFVGAKRSDALYRGTGISDQRVQEPLLCPQQNRQRASIRMEVGRHRRRVRAFPGAEGLWRNSGTTLPTAVRIRLRLR